MEETVGAAVVERFCCLAITEMALKNKGELSKSPGTREYGNKRTGGTVVTRISN